MMTRSKTLIFFAIYVLVLFLGFYTIKIGTTPAMAPTTKSAIFFLLERVFEVSLFIFLFFQVMLWSFLEILSRKLGKWIVIFYKIHSLLTFLVVFGFTFSMLMFNYFLKHSLDPFFVYIDVCFLCKTSADYFLTAGRIAFWSIGLTAFSLFAGDDYSFWRKYWRKLQNLNYLSFILVAIQGYFTGYDFQSKPFYFFVFIAIVGFFLTVLVKAPGWLKQLKR